MGELVVRPRDLEQAAQAGEVNLRVVRDGRELEVALEAEELGGRGTQRALLWAGALLQEPHLPIRFDHQLSREGVFLSWLWFGSPADRYSLGAALRILAVDGQPTADLDAFILAVRDKRDGESVRLEVRDLEDKPSVVTLELDLESWPTQELRLEPGGWARSDVVAGPE